jgi:hypothetical protein
MTTTATPQFTTESFIAAVKSVAATCTAPTLVTLTATGDTVTGRPEAIPGVPATAAAIAAACAGMAQLIARHPGMFPGDVADTRSSFLVKASRSPLTATAVGTTSTFPACRPNGETLSDGPPCVTASPP